LLNYDIIRAENSKDNWRTVIKFLSIALLLWGSIGAVLNMLEILASLFSSDDHNVHFTDSGASFIGPTNSFLKVLSLFQNLMIVMQGWIGYKATQKNTTSAIQDLISKSIYLVVIHLVLIFTQVLVAAVAIGKSGEE
jgi:hypothetical protein